MTFLALLGTISLIAYGTTATRGEEADRLDVQIAHEYIEQEQLEMAAPFLHRIVAKETSVAEAYFLLAYIEIVEGNPAEAEGLLQTAIAQKPDFDQAHFNLALVFLELGKEKEALESLERAIELAPAEESYRELYEQLKG